MARMAFATSRVTPIDPVALLAAVRSATGDNGAMIWLADVAGIAVEKSGSFAAQDVLAVQAAIDAAPVLTPQRDAQNAIDNLPILFRALVLALVDEINILRSAASLSPRTPAQALAAIRAKAGTL